MRVHLTLSSGNAKVGPIPVTTSEANTCPDTCGAFKACYAKSGPLLIHWRKVSEGLRGMEFSDFLAAVRKFPAGQLWRHNQAGDLPGTNQDIDKPALEALVRANTGRKGFTYTHKPMTPENQSAVKAANDKGFTINLSADSPRQADELKALGVGPVVTILPPTTKENMRTPAGNLVVICPAVTKEDVTCATCKLCQWKDRDVIIGFPSHGKMKNYIQVETN